MEAVIFIQRTQTLDPRPPWRRSASTKRSIVTRDKDARLASAIELVPEGSQINGAYAHFSTHAKRPETVHGRAPQTKKAHQPERTCNR